MSVQFSLADDHNEDHEVLDFHNAGAAGLLTLMGYKVPDDLSGTADPDDFYGRALLATGVLDLATADADGIPGFWEGRIYHGGRSPGYQAERLQLLLELGEHARERGVQVVWG